MHRRLGAVGRLLAARVIGAGVTAAEEYAELLDEARRDPNVVGLVLAGSHAAG